MQGVGGRREYTLNNVGDILGKWSMYCITIMWHGYCEENKNKKNLGNFETNNQILENLKKSPYLCKCLE
jgi:hypothetical protein